jgi:transposase
MAKTLEKEVVAAIELAITNAQKSGQPPDLHAIAARFNCTYQSVCYIRRRIEKHQRTGVDDRKKPGRKPLADRDKMAESIKGLLARRPGLDQSAIRDCLFDEYGVRLCQATISRMLRRNAIPHKISNKLYKKSKLFTTNEGCVIAGEASGAAATYPLPSASDETCKSPYASAAEVLGEEMPNNLMTTPSANMTSNHPSIGANAMAHNRRPTELENAAYDNPNP